VFALFFKLRFVLIAFLFAAIAFLFSRGAISSYFYKQGLKAKNEWQLQTAIRYFDWSLFFSNTFDARFEKGFCLQLRGDFLSSQKEFEKLLANRTNDKANLSRLHNSIGVNRFSFSEPDSAIASHQQALQLARETANKKSEAESLIGLSRVLYHSKGKFEDALANLQQAKSIAQEIKDEQIEADVLRNTGVVYWWFKNELDRPLNEFYLPALELYRKHNNLHSVAIMLSNISLIHNFKGDLYHFMQYQNESIAIKERIGDEAGLSDSYSSLGNTYNNIGNYRKAQEFYNKSLSIATRIGYRLTQNDVETMLAGVQVNLNEYDEAITLFNRILEREKNNPLLAKYRLVAIAGCHRHKGDFVQAISFYEQALKMSEQIGSPDERFMANTLMFIAESYIGLGDWQKASDYMARAENVFQKADIHAFGDTEQSIIRASLAQHNGNHKQALRYLQNAADVELRILTEAKTSFLLPPHHKIYERLFSFLLKNNQTNSRLQGELAFRFLENMRYRTLRNFEIQVREKSDNPKPISLHDIQQKLADTALVEFLSVGEKVFALVITKTNFDIVSLPISKNSLAAKTKLFRSLIFNKDENENAWLPVAESLRASLIEPIEKVSVLKDVKRIGFIPFGFLHDLPFAALARNDNGSTKFLVEDYALFQAPSATFHAHKSKSVPPAPTGRYANITDPPVGAGGTDLLTIAFGRNESNEENLPDLEFASDEAQAVSQITNGIAFTNKQATETELKQRADDCDVLHLSAHAIAESDMPLFSRLLLEPTDTDDGNLTVKEIFELGLKTKLVTLSACETGQSFSASGNDFTEQDRVGLIEAFLHAGSDSVLASQFPVSDKPTAEFMKIFYQNLREKDKVNALAETQRAMIHNKTRPRHWSPFFIVGTDR
jgi:CHAT domain-containing protein